MPALTPEFLFDFESNMQAITEDEYSRMGKNLYWQRVMKTRPSSSKRERIAWLLSTAMIEDVGKGGNIPFEDLVSKSVEYTHKRAAAGLELQRDQVEDLDGNGLDLAAKWSGDMGKYMAYWPQKQMIKAIKNGTSATLGKCYDGKAFFATDHPLNPFRSSAGTYSNLLAYSTYKIDDSVTVDVALQNLGKAVAAIQGVKMPNGEDPRFLVPKAIIAPPRMSPRVQQLTGAKLIAQAAASGGGGADVEPIIRNWNWAPPIEAPELATAITGVNADDTSYYILCEDAGATQLGPLVYIERKPFAITYYTGAGGGNGVDAILDRANTLEWHLQGRNVTGYGHPFLLFKIAGS